MRDVPDPSKSFLLSSRRAACIINIATNSIVVTILIMILVINMIMIRIIIFPKKP